jgi:hypothetical protein
VLELLGDAEAREDAVERASRNVRTVAGLAGAVLVSEELFELGRQCLAGGDLG